MKCEKISVIAVLQLLITKCTAERKSMFYTHLSILNSDVEFVHKVCFNHKFNELEGHQWLNLVKEALNEDDLEGLVVKIIMFDDNAQELSIVFLKIVIFLLAGLQFKLSFHD